jgi:hypothetical protein
MKCNNESQNNLPTLSLKVNLTSSHYQSQSKAHYTVRDRELLVLTKLCHFIGTSKICLLRKTCFYLLKPVLGEFLSTWPFAHQRQDQEAGTSANKGYRDSLPASETTGDGGASLSPIPWLQAFFRAVSELILYGLILEGTVVKDKCYQLVLKVSFYPAFKKDYLRMNTSLFMN